MANRLQYESSPYLLQHAHNPVDWYPWGDEAFEKATAENKPVLISIGYAACHWCHVMERESFEDAAVAAFMNEHFICIKVDREEHPDVDHLYMDALQAMTGSGGWPLNMFVTPERKPFYGGTYFPPENRYGRISWKELLGALHRAWNEKPEEIQLQSQQMLEHLKQASLVAAAPREEQSLDKEAIDLITANLLQQADEVFGGFGAAPKFPASAAIQFLLEQYHYQKKEYPVMAKAALDQALLSIDRMIQGGIYDQAGGGFARYATDNEWLVPHFEKMLYDNALLLSVLSDAYRLTGKQHYARVIRETLAFCYKELGFEATGGFYCALDADSEGVEGKFYTWTWAEWQEQMGDAHPALAAYFGVSEVGNWEGTNILHEAQPEAHILDQFGLSADNWEGILEEAKARLKEKRAERVRPLTDEKQLLSWNALMNIALVDAGIALQEDSYLADAVKHMDWMLATFSREDGSCNHVYHKDGAARIDAKLDDYAYLVKALWYLAAATGRTALLTTAVKLMDHTEQHFLHEQRQFYYFSSDRQRDIIVRKVELYDGATPSANAVMMENLWIMGNLMENGSWLEQGEAMMHAMKQTVLRYPVSFSRWAVLMQRYQRGLKQLVIAGPNAMAWLKDWHRHYYPEIAVIAVERGERDVAAAREKYKQGEDRFYLCRHFSCLSPVTTLEALLDQAEHS